MKLIELNNLAIGYKKNIIASNLNFTINAGEIVSILGPNGAGKSTLLKVIAGILNPVHGKINKKKALKISYIPQHLGLIKSKTVQDNILNGILPELNFIDSIFLRFSKKHIDQCLNLAKEFKIDHLLKIECYKLSGGEKRRVAIARSLMLNPDLILADEILSDLDFLKSRLIINQLKKLQQTGTSVILIEHDLCLAKDLSSHVYLMNQGQLHDNFDPKQISDLKLCKLFK